MHWLIELTETLDVERGTLLPGKQSYSGDASDSRARTKLHRYTDGGDGHTGSNDCRIRNGQLCVQFYKRRRRWEYRREGYTCRRRIILLYLCSCRGYVFPLHSQYNLLMHFWVCFCVVLSDGVGSCNLLFLRRPGLALRGGTGSVSHAYVEMKKERWHIVWSFNISVFAFGVSILHTISPSYSRVPRFQAQCIVALWAYDGVSGFSWPAFISSLIFIIGAMITVRYAHRSRSSWVQALDFKCVNV